MAKIIRYGLWDCPQCGSKRISGKDRECPNCGKPRGAGTRFYLDKAAPAITNKEELAKVAKGADWYCENCGSGNSILSSVCVNCGAKHDTDPHQEIYHYTEETLPRDGGDPIAEEEAKIRAGYEQEAPEQFAPTESFWQKAISWLKANWRVYLPYAIGAVVAGFIAMFIVMGVSLHEETAKITGFSWERSVSLEENKLLREQAWEIPAGGKEISSQTRIRSYVTVIDHYETRTRRVSRWVDESVLAVPKVLLKKPIVKQSVASTPDDMMVADSDYTDNGDGTFTEDTGDDYDDNNNDYGNDWGSDSGGSGWGGGSGGGSSDDDWGSGGGSSGWDSHDDGPSGHYEYYDETYQEPVYRQDPVYDTWYTYDIWRWVPSRTPTVSANDQKPYWPEYSLKDLERVSGKEERYQIKLERSNGDTISQSATLDYWSQKKVGDKVIILVNGFGTFRRIKQ